MGDIVNLRRAREAKARQSLEVEAAENRARFGQTKFVRKNNELKQTLETRQHAAHRRDGVNSGDAATSDNAGQTDSDG